MIHRLRRKFVLINMALVALVLLIVFSVAMGIGVQQQRAAGDSAMRGALGREAGTPPDRFPIGNGKQQNAPAASARLHPVFTVSIESGGSHILDRGNVEVSDEVVALAVEEALATGAREGTLASLNLRFLREDHFGSVKLAFLDRSVEQEAIRRQAITFTLILLAGLCAFFVISLFLAGWALAPVKAAWAQQQQFVADASHELKTPLTVILANLGIIESHPEQPVASQLKWLDNTKQEATRMRSLVDGMLFLAKADAAEAALEMARVSLTDVVWRGVLSFEPVAYEQGVTLDSLVAPDIAVRGDEGQLAQLTGILLDNACKYAGAGGAVRVTLSAMQDRAQLAVHNTGEPIAPEALEHIFERFYRADAARARSEGGYGLGLAIAERIASRHGGRITAESGAQSGTTFRLTLPVEGRRQG